MWLFKQHIYKSSPEKPSYTFLMYPGVITGQDALCSSYSATPLTLYTNSTVLAVGTRFYTDPGLSIPYNGGNLKHYSPADDELFKITGTGIISEISTCMVPMREVVMTVDALADSSTEFQVIVNGVVTYSEVVASSALYDTLSIPVGASVVVKCTASSLSNFAYLSMYVHDFTDTIYTENTSGGSPVILETHSFMMPDSPTVEIEVHSSAE